VKRTRIIFLLIFASGLLITSCAPLVVPHPPPTLTTSPTLTPSPTPIPTLEPATYLVEKCMNMVVPSGLIYPFEWEFEECVDSITVQPDGLFKVNFRWTFTKLGEGELEPNYCITKVSDHGNKNMFMMDDLGKRYDHIEVGKMISIALLCQGDGRIRASTTDYFLFPGVDPEASYLIFFDDDQGLKTAPFTLHDFDIVAPTE